MATSSDWAVEAPGLIKIFGENRAVDGVDETLSATENLILFRRLHGLGRAESRAKASELLETFGLTEAAKRSLKNFSGGMRRRLDLAARLISQPPLIFLDEADQLAVVDRVVAEGTGDELRAPVGESTLDDVFLTLTGHGVEENKSTTNSASVESTGSQERTPRRGRSRRHRSLRERDGADVCDGLHHGTSGIMGFRAEGGLGYVIAAGLLVIGCAWALSWIFAFFGVIARSGSSVQGISFFILFPSHVPVERFRSRGHHAELAAVVREHQPGLAPGHAPGHGRARPGEQWHGQLRPVPGARWNAQRERL